MMQAIGQAMSGQVGDSFFHAVTDNPKDAEKLISRHKAQKAVQNQTKKEARGKAR